MKLAKLIGKLDVTSKDFSEIENKLKETDIKKIAYHSNEATEDSLFVCIKGYQTDGHDFAEKAVQQGASVIIVEREILGLEVPQIKVADSRKALAVIAAAFYNQPSKDLRVFGVTGTNGKTTITYLVDALLRGYGLNTGLIGTVMIKNKEKVEKSKLTTPESADLQRYLASMREEGVTHVSMEVSSSALDLKRVAQTQFDIVAFTNINHDHIDLHGSFESYFNAKASLIRKASENSFALINIDEPLLVPLTNQTKAEVITFGIENAGGSVSMSDIDMTSGKPTFTVNIQQTLHTKTGKRIDPVSFKIILQVPGYHSIYNATTAILAALLNDLPIEYVRKEIGKFKGVERRFHVLYDKEFTIIDDLLLNENNVDSCMRTVKELEYNTLHIVHAIRGNNGTELNTKNAEAMARWIHQLNQNEVIVTTSQSHVKAKDQVLASELKAFLDVMKQNEIKVFLFEELESALALGLNNLKHGDLLLISGARGMDDGARICLDLMMEMYPSVDKKAINDVLKDKWVGMEAAADVTNTQARESL